jgi:hypothetical protein
MVRIYTGDGEFTDREMNDNEFAQYKLDVAARTAEKEAETSKAQAKAALLAQLGITAEQAKLLLS